MSKGIKNLDTEETRRFWEHAEKTAKRVESWPEWKKVGISNRNRPERKLNDKDESKN